MRLSIMRTLFSLSVLPLLLQLRFLFFFFFNDTATTEIYTLSLHDALPIFCTVAYRALPLVDGPPQGHLPGWHGRGSRPARSEEHTSELQSHLNLVCRLLLEKKKKQMPSIA